MGASGNVAGALLDGLADDHPMLGRHRNPTTVIGLANRQGFAINHGGFSIESLRLFASQRQAVTDLIRGQRKIDGLSETKITPNAADEMLDVLQRSGYDGQVIFVDVTPERDVMRDFHLRVITKTRNRIVTANKNPLSLYGTAIYRTLTNDPHRCGYRATTMAGLGAVPWISEGVTAGDEIFEIKASLSGTLGFIASRLEEGTALSAAIRQAKEEGYTESDPRDDLSGLDVARKLIILAREAGQDINLNDISLEPFLPQEYVDKGLGQEAWLEKIVNEYDSEMAQRMATAQKSGKTLRYLAKFEFEGGQLKLKVSLEEVEQNSNFGRLHGTTNLIEVSTKIYSKARGQQWTLSGPGAGRAQTAFVLRKDLVQMQKSIDRYSLSR